MERVPCAHCALPVRVRRVERGAPVYCCPGCALAARLPRGGDWPLTPELGVACGVVLVFFNQVMLTLLAVLVAGEGRFETAERLQLVAGVGGVLTWLGLTWALHRVGSRRGWDLTLAGLSGLTLLVGLIGLSPWCAVAANAGLLLWAGRGVWRRR
jgi:heme/copper-type cytochrome/quinol oxidase subunit 4